MDENLLYGDLLEVLDKATPSTWEKEWIPVYGYETPRRGPLAPPGKRFDPLRPNALAPPRIISRRVIKHPRRTRQFEFNKAPVKASFPDEVNNKRLILDNLRRERLNQVRVTFAIAIGTLILGILLVFTGVVLAFIVNLSLSIVTTISSVITGIISGLAFKFHTDANSDLNKIIKQLIIVEQISLATELIEKISDKKLQNDALTDLIKYVHSSVPSSP